MRNKAETYLCGYFLVPVAHFIFVAAVFAFAAGRTALSRRGGPFRGRGTQRLVANGALVAGDCAALEAVTHIGRAAAALTGRRRQMRHIRLGAFY